MGSLRVVALYVHPVKSCRGVEVAEAVVEPRGFRHDRRFLVVDEAGRFLTQRTVPRMARLVPAIDEAAGTLTLTAPDADPGLGPLVVDLRVDGPRAPVTVWRDTVVAISVEAATGWLTRALGRPARLARLPDDVERAVDPTCASPGDVVSFADGFPYLVATTASLARLVDEMRARSGDPAVSVPMERFRPNLVIEGAAPFAEDGWRAIRIGGIPLSLPKPCARCSIPSLDHVTGERGVDPMPALAALRTRGNNVLFGQNAIARGAGVVRVGDSVDVEEGGA